MIDIKAELLQMSDYEYKKFHSKLMPTISVERVIGVRTPLLRRFATKLYRYDINAYENFLRHLPHEYYEENNLHAFLIEKIEDYDKCMEEVNLFLPYIDNWATCDCMSPKVFAKNKDRLYEQIKIWLTAKHTYTVRYAIKTLMSFYSKESFDIKHIELITNISSEEYYIKMAVAWYFATVLAFHYDEVICILREHRLDTWIHNKTIQKAIESYRVSDEHKTELKLLKI